MSLKFDILEDVNRPIILQNNIRMLFDTGASTPVWCVGIKSFHNFFPDAENSGFIYILSGFGRTEKELRDFLRKPTDEKAKIFLTDVYSIPSFSLATEEGDAITWKNLRVAVTEKESIGVDLILPSTMFRGMDLRWSQMNVNDPYIEIISRTNVKYVFVQLHSDKFLGTELVKYIYPQGEVTDADHSICKEEMSHV